MCIFCSCFFFKLVYSPPPPHPKKNNLSRSEKKYIYMVTSRDFAKFRRFTENRDPKNLIWVTWHHLCLADWTWAEPLWQNDCCITPQNTWTDTGNSHTHCTTLQMYGSNLVKVGTFWKNVPTLFDWISRAGTITWPTGDLKSKQNECGTNWGACFFLWKIAISVNFRAISAIGVFLIRSELWKKSTNNTWLNCEKERWWWNYPRSPISHEQKSQEPRKPSEKKWEQPCCLALSEHRNSEKTRVIHSEAPYRRQTIAAGSRFQDTPYYPLPCLRPFREKNQPYFHPRFGPFSEAPKTQKSPIWPS